MFMTGSISVKKLTVRRSIILKGNQDGYSGKYEIEMSESEAAILNTGQIFFLKGL